MDPPAFERIIIRITMAPSFSIPTVTILKPCVTTLNNREEEKDMASDLNFVEYVCDQARDVAPISFKKMFGEYALYLENKVVALVCDNQLFVKQTQAGRALLKTVVESPPYPGAKPHFLIGENIDDRDLMRQLFKVTGSELPEPKPKKSKMKRAKK